MTLAYRAELDGLRAVAILAVMVFHTAPQALPGGFTGVDLFFVVSGYLITRIVVGEHTGGHFSFAAFYERRAKRLLAPLLLVITSCLGAGLLLLFPGDYLRLCSSAAAALGFAANFYFWTATGYFDPPAHSMPLLHTWSLGVEEQFYLAWPALLVVLLRTTAARPRRALTWIALLAIASAAASALIAPDSAFYLPWTRAWQLLAGAMVSLLPARKAGEAKAEALALAGALAILVGLATTPEGATPLRAGALPTLGASLLIAFAPGTRTAAALSLRPLVFVGRVSYSLYLWHWPLLSFARHYLDWPASQPLPIEHAALASALALGLSALSLRFVEQPLRASASRPLRTLALCAPGIVVVAGLLAIVWASGGARGRVPPAVASLESADRMWAWDCPERARVDGLSDRPLCTLGAPREQAAVRGLIWGDSHAEHYLPALDLAGRDTETSLALWRQCIAFLDGDRWRTPGSDALGERCAKSRSQVLSWLAEARDVGRVVLGGAWHGVADEMLLPGTELRADPVTGLALMREAMTATLRAASAPGRIVVVLGEVPRPERLLAPCEMVARGARVWRRCVAADRELRRQDVERRQGDVERMLKEVTAAVPGVRFVSAIDALCDAERCDTRVGDELLFRDGGHLRRNLPESTLRALTDRLGLRAALGPATAVASGAQFRP